MIIKDKLAPDNAMQVEEFIKGDRHQNYFRCSS